MSLSRREDGKLSILAKVLMVGDSSVGKTTLKKKIEGSSSDSFAIGVKISELDSLEIRVQLWDVAVQEEQLTKMLPAYLRNSFAVVVCYDCTRRATFDAVDDWIEKINKIKNELLPDAKMVLVSTKNDVEKTISSEEGQEKAKNLGFECFIETSPITGEGVDTLLNKLNEMLVTRFQREIQAEESQQDGFQKNIDSFFKIYNALLNGQSGLKSDKWKSEKESDPEKLWRKIEEHGRLNPDSRTAEALRLLKAFPNFENRSSSDYLNIRKACHAWSLKKTVGGKSTVPKGFFATTEALEKKVMDEPKSRTAKIDRTFCPGLGKR